MKTPAAGCSEQDHLPGSPARLGDLTGRSAQSGNDRYRGIGDGEAVIGGLRDAAIGCGYLHPPPQRVIDEGDELRRARCSGSTASCSATPARARS
jgi:hypothetical protein